jgi:hypothetical protein
MANYYLELTKENTKIIQVWSEKLNNC